MVIRGCMKVRRGYLRGVKRCVMVTEVKKGDAPWLLRGCKEVRHGYKGGTRRCARFLSS